MLQRATVLGASSGQRGSSGQPDWNRQRQQKKHPWPAALFVLLRANSEEPYQRHAALRASMAGIITKVFEAEMTAEQLRVLAGKARCKDASTKVELAYGALLAVVQRGDAGFESLPVAAQRSIDGSAVCKREMERAKNALAVLDEADADWAAMRHAMQQLPPAALLHILSEEMTAEQMRTLAGKARCEEAKTKAQLAYAVLLTLSLRASGIKGLPANAEQRIEASPVCVDWLAELAISRLRPDYDGGWREFMRVLLDRKPCERPTTAASPPATGPRSREGGARQTAGKLLTPRTLFDGADDAGNTPMQCAHAMYCAVRSCNVLCNAPCNTSCNAPS